MNKDQFSFIIYLIHACANQWKKAPSQIYRALKQSGCIKEYLLPLYDILHTQSTKYLVDDIANYLNNRGIVI